MTTLEGYVVVPALYQQAGGSEAQVGDQIKLYLDTDAQPGFPEFILGVIQHPILRVCDGTSYSVEYDEADLIVAEAIHPDDVVSAEVFQAWDQLGATLEAEIARATAAEAALTADIALKSPLAGSTSLVLAGDLVAASVLTSAVGANVSTSGNTSHIETTGDASHIRTIGAASKIYTLGDTSGIETHGASAAIQTLGDGSPIQTQGLSDIQTSGGGDIKSSGNFTQTGTTPNVFNSVVKFGVYTVATLPGTGSVAYGSQAFVTDANATHAAGVGTAVAGGGANFVPVYSDGSNWIIG